MSDRANILAKRQEREIQRIERIGVRASRVVTVRIKQMALREYRTGIPQPIGDMVVDKLFPHVRDAMIVTHLLGHRRSMMETRRLRSEVRKREMSLALSPFKSVLGVLAQESEADMFALNRMYGTTAMTVVSGVGRSTETALRITMSALTSSGAHVKEGMAVLGKRFESLGLSPDLQHPYRLEAIFRTQTRMSYSAGQWQADSDPAIQEILWGYEYSAIEDGRERLSHGAMNGFKAPKDDPIWQSWWAPNGWNCRCRCIQVFDEGTRSETRNDESGVPILPDKGFNFNPGTAIGQAPSLKDPFRLPRKTRVATGRRGPSARRGAAPGAPRQPRAVRRTAPGAPRQPRAVKRTAPRRAAAAARVGAKALKKVAVAEAIAPAKFVDWKTLNRGKGEPFPVFEKRRQAARAMEGPRIGDAKAKGLADLNKKIHDAASLEYKGAFQNVGASMWGADYAHKIKKVVYNDLVTSYSRLTPYRIARGEVRQAVFRPLTVLDSFPKIANNPKLMRKLNADVIKITRKYEKEWAIAVKNFKV